MAKVACPSNYLAARENYQVAKYRLRRTEDELFEAFEVKTIANLETAMLRERSKKYPRFSELTARYNREHQALGAADEIFEAATVLQRQHIAAMQEHDRIYKTLDE